MNGRRCLTILLQRPQHNYRYLFVPTDIHSHFNFKTTKHIIVTTIFQGDV